jgi:hypothetical protein
VTSTTSGTGAGTGATTLAWYVAPNRKSRLSYTRYPHTARTTQVTPVAMSARMGFIVQSPE